MNDDLITISECGLQTTKTHSYIITKTAIKKLHFGPKKNAKNSHWKIRKDRFDSLWLVECITDVYNEGVQDDFCTTLTSM